MAQVNGSKTLSGHHGGHWNVCTYVRLYGINIDFGATVFLSSVLAPASSIELGCGMGVYTSWLARGGAAPAWGIEPDGMPSSIFSTGSWPRQLAAHIFGSRSSTSKGGGSGDGGYGGGGAGGDSSRDIHACVDALGTFDLVLTFEVAEHVPRELHDSLADFLVARTSRFLVFSASPHRSGHGHISPRSRSEWRLEFERRGMVYMPELTRALLLESQEVNHKRNSLIFAASEAIRLNDSKVLTAIHYATNSTLKHQRTKRAKVLAIPACGAPNKGQVLAGGQVVPWRPWFKSLTLKRGEVAIWPELVAELSSCFGKPFESTDFAPTPSCLPSNELLDALPRLPAPFVV